MGSPPKDRNKRLLVWLIIAVVCIVLMCWIAWLAAAPIRFGLGSARMPSSPEMVRLQVLVAVLFVLLFSFVLAVAWALVLYVYLRKDEPLKDIAGTEDHKDIAGTEDHEGRLHFHEIALEHKLWAQLWFTISMGAFLGGVIYAVSRPLTSLADVSSGSNEYLSFAKEVITELFIFSLFYLAWNWSVRHFRAHWHNFILNAYRYRALSVLRLMRNEQGESETGKDEIRRLSGLLLLMTEPSAYLDNERETTLLERIIKLDDWVKKVLTGAKPV
jgi:membrane protein implicated in regulation of membrane protease activity